MRIIPAEQFQLNRSNEYGTPEQNEQVRAIVETVKRQGDAAIRRYTQQLDGVNSEQFAVSAEEVEAAYALVDEAFVEALRKAIANIRAFHEKQRRNSWMDAAQDGSILGLLFRPLQRVGVYVPGGKAAYPSSVLMNMIPALVAGVPEIAMMTPPATAGEAGINPGILVAAGELGIKEIYRIGGAQAIAAFAYGTETIRGVDKIVGPGNIYVALAKRYVYGKVDIDSLAGPSEIVVLADEQADPAFVAADLLSQAEHDELASAVLITDSPVLAQAVSAEVDKQLQTLPRRSIAAKSLEQFGAILMVDNLAAGIEVVNALAPEHLAMMVREPMSWLGQVRNAGAIFIGEYSSEPVGDYFAGPNHIIPTNGTAKFASPLNVDAFMKKSSLIHYSKQALQANGEYIMKLARQEGLEAHARAIQIRLEKEGIQG